MSEFMAFIERHISPEAWTGVLSALAGYGDSEINPEALPAPV